MSTKTQKIIEAKVRKMVRRKLAEALIGGFGFSKNDAIRLSLLRANEASINKKNNDFDPPIKGGKKKSDFGGAEMPSTEPPVQKDIGKDIGIDSPDASKPEDGVDDMGGLDKPEKPKEEKSKSKDWDEITNEVHLYVKQASNMVGDPDGTQRDKILKKLIDAVESKFSESSVDVDAGLDEKKKAKKKK